MKLCRGAEDCDFLFGMKIIMIMNIIIIIINQGEQGLWGFAERR